MPNKDRRIDVTIVHPFDPWRQGLGGFDTFLDAFLRLAPAEWRLEVVGLTRDPQARPPGRRTLASFGGRSLEFVPLLCDTDPYAHRLVPLSLRFAIAGWAYGPTPRGRIVQYHRFESPFACRPLRFARSVCFLHNHPPELASARSDVRWRHFGSLYHRVLRRALADVDSIWGVDPRTPAWVEEVMPRLAGRTFHQPVWADSDLFRPGSPEERERDRLELRAELQLETWARICVFVGRLEAQKDPLLLVDAFERVAATTPGVFLAFVGRGRLRREISKRAASLGIESHLRFLAPRDRRELASVYRGADASVCCSAFESGPRTVFETLACGTPAVTVDVGQVAEPMTRLSDLGLMIETRDAGRVARAIERALRLVPGAGLSARLASAVAGFTPDAALEPLFRRYGSWLRRPWE